MLRDGTTLFFALLVSQSPAPRSSSPRHEIHHSQLSADRLQVFCAAGSFYVNSNNFWKGINDFLSPFGYTDIAGDKCAKKEANTYHDAVFVSKNCKGPFCSRKGLEIHVF